MVVYRKYRMMYNVKEGQGIIGGYRNIQRMYKVNKTNFVLNIVGYGG